uniref:Uncharacterized protein n=1 Tax=Arundo donax TaxID=35708 RepID=A0A0A9FAF4_ARUDO
MRQAAPAPARSLTAPHRCTSLWSTTWPSRRQRRG